MDKGQVVMCNIQTQPRRSKTHVFFCADPDRCINPNMPARCSASEELFKR